MRYNLLARWSMRLFMAVAIAMAAMIPAVAQERNHPRKEISKEVREFRIKYVAQEMELKEDQMEKFVDTYTALMEERKAASDEVRKLERKVGGRNNNNASEADYKALTDARNRAKAADAEITARYDKKFATFLTQKQIFKMKEAEDRFRERMAQMRKAGNGGHGKRNKSK